MQEAEIQPFSNVRSLFLGIFLILNSVRTWNPKKPACLHGPGDRGRRLLNCVVSVLAIAGGGTAWEEGAE
jgi:hypothetical protein